MRTRRGAVGGLVAGLVLVGLSAWMAAADGTTRTVRFAFLPQVVAGQFANGRDLRTAVDGGVVDRTVFFWRRGLIERKSLVLKPIRLLAGEEAERLGGRGQFQLGAVRASRGASAWVEVDLGQASGGPDDQAVLEVGGERYPIRQVLAALFVGAPGESLEELRLSPRALVPGPGVPVVQVSAGAPVVLPGGAAAFRGVGGVGFVVVRSPIRTRVDADFTTNGPADRAEVPLDGPDDWRDGDRVLVRISAAALREGVPAVVMAWKDRTYQTDPDPGAHEPILK